MSRQLILVVALLWSRPLWAEDLDAPDASSIDDNVDWNQYESEYFSFRAGMGMLLDYSSYAQNPQSAEQMSLDPTGGIRDLRFLASGRLFSKKISYTLGYMYDANADKWVFRQTGLKLQFPQLGGYLFIGRTKEGFSTNKLMVGYYGIFSERAAANDAFIPILADGLRWNGGGFGGHLVYNLGVFFDQWSEVESFNRNDWQAVGRAVWLPLPLDSPALLHVAVDARYAGADDGLLRFRSKPEAFLAQSFAVDTEEFEASRTAMLGVETYYRPGSLLLGLEYYFNQVTSMVGDDPFFNGGEIFASYLLTGEEHPYNYKGGFFEAVKPRRDFVSGGPGAWELALRLTYVDLSSGPIQGGRFLRVTPTLNWYVTETLRFEASYGYGVLNRMDMTGDTQFLLTRMQLAI